MNFQTNKYTYNDEIREIKTKQKQINLLAIMWRNTHIFPLRIQTETFRIHDELDKQKVLSLLKKKRIMLHIIY